MGGGVEDAEDLGVHHDRHVVLLDHVLVAGFHACIDPVGEGLAHERVRDVDDPLARQLVEIIYVGEVRDSRWMLARFVEELLDAEAFVLRHGQVLHLVGVNELLGAGDESFEEVYGDVLVRREVGAALDRGELVPADKVSEDDGHLHFTLRLVLGGESSGSNRLPCAVV